MKSPPGGSSVQFWIPTPAASARGLEAGWGRRVFKRFPDFGGGTFGFPVLSILRIVHKWGKCGLKLHDRLPWMEKECGMAVGAPIK